MDLIHPHTPAGVAEFLRAASADRSRMRVVGGRQHSVPGPPVEAELWTTGLDGVVAYDPAEMLCVVEAGVRMHDLRETLAAGSQEWPVDESGDATVGGVIAADVALPRQLRVGLLRDSVVEMSFATGDGRVIRSGARTVKNVTGYDVHRLLTGARGTLGVITQVALKLRPLPKVARTLVTNEGGLELGMQLLEAVPLPAAVVVEHDRVLVRLEGWPDEVEEQARAATTVAVMADDDPASWLDTPFHEAAIVARAAVPPSRLSALLEGVDRFRSLLGVGYAWVPCDDAEALATLRKQAHELGGSAPVVRGDGGLDLDDLPLAEVQGRIKAALDPAGVLVG
jgi:glycolate oxidase FAD binding subunit